MTTLDTKPHFAGDRSRKVTVGRLVHVLDTAGLCAAAIVVDTEPVIRVPDLETIRLFVLWRDGNTSPGLYRPGIEPLSWHWPEIV